MLCHHIRPGMCDASQLPPDRLVLTQVIARRQSRQGHTSLGAIVVLPTQDLAAQVSPYGHERP